MKDVPALDIKDLHKTFGQNEVLKGISLSAHKGDVVSIIGSSGSGKSTFLRCINLLETPTAGEIWVNGELIQMKNNRLGESIPANEKQVQRIRSRLAMVFQGFNLWSHLTVLENVIEAPVHVLGVPKAQAIENAETHSINFDELRAGKANIKVVVLTNKHELSFSTQELKTFSEACTLESLHEGAHIFVPDVALVKAVSLVTHHFRLKILKKQNIKWCRW